MPTLNSEDKAKIKRAIPKSSNKILTASVARLYVSFPDPQKWRFTGLSGALVLAKDTVGNTYFLKLVDVIGTGQVLWDQELWTGFQYNQDRTFFHSFEIEGILVGLSFAEESEAHGFYKKVSALKLGQGMFTLGSGLIFSTTGSCSSCQFTSHSTVTGPNGSFIDRQVINFRTISISTSF